MMPLEIHNIAVTPGGKDVSEVTQVLITHSLCFFYRSFPVDLHAKAGAVKLKTLELEKRTGVCMIDDYRSCMLFSV